MKSAQVFWMALCLRLVGGTLVFGANEGELTIAVLDQETKQPLAVRMHLVDQRGKPVIPSKVVAWKDHFVFDEHTTLVLRPGTYQFTVERGPEYRDRTGSFTVERNAVDNHVLYMERFVDMKQEGWWSGDLHIHRDPKDIEILMRAEDLHIAPVITWWNNQDLWDKRPVPDQLLTQFDNDRFYQVMAGEYERAGGALLFFNLDKPLPVRFNPAAPPGDKAKQPPANSEIREARKGAVPRDQKRKSGGPPRSGDAAQEYPPGARFLEMAESFPDAHVDIEKPFWKDVPIWIGCGGCDSIGLANNHLWRSGGLMDEAWGKARDTRSYPGPQGNGRWSQDIYYQLLNCGLHLPPSAGSASGVLNNPVGYNRVYVYCGADFSWQRWWQGLRDGKVIVTNGPLLRPRVNGQVPGHVFQSSTQIELNIALDLGTSEKVEYLEVIKNGRVAQSVPLREYVDKQGKLPPVVFDESGWMLIRAVTNNQTTYRFASTGPYYVEMDGQKRISKSAVQFFSEWLDERTAEIKLDDPEQQAEVLEYHQRARRFWDDLASKANAE